MGSDTVQIAAKGAWGTVEWAIDLKGEMPAREYYLKLPNPDKAKVNTMFQYIANSGFIKNREKFRQLGVKAGTKARGFWEFKSFQVRFIGDFRPGGRFIIAIGTTKKKDKLSQDEIEKAIRILSEHDAREGGVR